MASMTASGFCDEAALSRNASGLPLTLWLKIGKSARMACTSSVRSVGEDAKIITPASRQAHLGGEGFLQAMPHAGVRDAVEHRLEEGVDDQLLGDRLRNAARHQV